MSSEPLQQAAAAAFTQLPRSLHERDTKNRHLVRAALVGVLAGLVAVGFKWSLAGCETLRILFLHRLHALPHADAWAWSVLPVVAFGIGSFVGWIVWRHAPDAPGSGIPHLKGVLLHIRTMGWKKLIPIKFVGGALAVGSGLSSGREGPTVQMGAAIAKGMAEVMRVPPRAVPQLISCGAGAGLAAAFNAPLAGFLFVIEELHRELSGRTFAGALVAALSANIVARALGGSLPSFEVTGYPPIPLAALPVAALLGVLGGVCGVVFNRGLLRSNELALKIRAFPRWMAPGVACAICGLVAWWMPEAVGGGHLTAELLLNGRLGWGIAGLFALLAVKWVLTLVSYASGAPGGVFAPMLIFGAIIGLILGMTLAGVFPSLAPHATAFAILGMAAFFTGSVRAPLTAIVLIVEMTGNYQQLLALGVTCVLADLVAGWLRDTPLYEALLEADLRHSPPAVGNGNGEVAEPRAIYIGVQRGSVLAGTTIRTSGLPSGCLVVSVERSGREVHPEAGLELLPGDHLSVLVPDGESHKAMEVVRMATGL